jgi:hypothetical protein
MGFLRVGLVVIAEEVQRAVDREVRDLDGQ